ncbi:PREDICTED: uromodulin-like 1 [Nanorana parkeri]|uniref:uromodulin-like 1 n=1 Tax=Nanorana parkeri TaxID=125878 RepID=UPI000853F60B|nr:PREDICTED: uromodulin-like 1 [Nanorana parkeri]
MDRKDILYLAVILGLSAGLGNGQMLACQMTSGFAIDSLVCFHLQPMMQYLYFPFNSFLHTGNMISPVSYHVCKREVTVNVSKVVLFQKQHEEKSLCMGWIPLKLCSRTYYVTEYRTILVPDTMVIKECCEGYEPVGHYCAMSANSPKLTATRPGACPAKIDDWVLCPECTEDYGCPGFQKCCDTSAGSFCVSPELPALDRNTIKFWYNGTITIKMKFLELLQLDPGYANHTRLLHAMVTGALWPLEAVVHHISTQPAGPFTIVSRILIGINESVPLQVISTSLSNIAIRLPEVINIQIDDLDECLHRELGACPPLHHCVNTEGSYICSKPNCTHLPPLGQGCSTFLNHSISNVTTSGFHIRWSTDCPDSHLYNIQISSEKIHRSVNVSETSRNISGLNAGELYTVLVTFRNCSGETQLWKERVKTEGQIMNGSLKIDNWNLTGDMQNPNSTQYGDFVEKFIDEVKLSLSGHVPPDQVSVHIVSLSPGSIVVNFLIIINDMKNHTDVTVSSLSAISHNSTFQVDPQSIKIADFNECLSPSDNDCDIHADCKNLDTSFTCECHPTYIDRDPRRPGRKCEGMAVGGPSMTSMASTHSTNPKDTSPPTTSSAAEHIIQVTGQSTQSATAPTDHLNSTASTPEILKTGQFVSSTPTTVTIVPSPPGASKTTPQDATTPKDPKFTTIHPSTSNNGRTTLALAEHSPTDPTTTSTTSNNGRTTLALAEHVTTDPTITSSTSNNGSTTLALAEHSMTDPTTTSTTSNNGRTTLVLAEHLTTDPTTTSTTSNNGRTTLALAKHPMTSTIPKLTAAQERMCSSMPMSKNPHVESTSTPLMALQAMTTHPTSSLTLRDASKVICETGKIGISIKKDFLRMMSISSHSLFLGSPECSVNCSTDTHILLLAGWKDCNTELFRNNTHTVVNSTLYIGLATTSQNVTPGAVILIRCVFQNDILLSSGYNPAGGIYTIIENLEGQGSFRPEFQLFLGDQPIMPNFTLSATDDVTVRIGIKTEDSQLKVVISECWATTTENAYDPMSFPFIKSSCALPNTFTTIQTNGISSNATFQTKIFSFVNKPIVYLHCRLYVCQEDTPNACRPSCSSYRASARSGDILKEVTQMGPLRMASRSHDSDGATNATLSPGYIILIAIGALAVISIAIAILVCWHQRRTGNYNFKMNIRDVGYQVFSN